MICSVCGRVDWSKREPPLFPPGRCRCVRRVNLRQLVADERAKIEVARAAAATRGVQLGLSLGKDP